MLTVIFSYACVLYKPGLAAFSRIMFDKVSTFQFFGLDFSALFLDFRGLAKTNNLDTKRFLYLKTGAWLSDQANFWFHKK